MSALARTTTLGPDPAGRTLRRLAQGRGLRLMLRAALMALATAGLAAAALGAATDLLAPRDGAGQSPAGGAASGWSDINHPIALYDLAGTEFGRLPLAYHARRRRPGGAREDVMTFGTLGTSKPYLQVSLLRFGAEGPDSVAGDDPTDTLARLAGTLGGTATQVRAAVPLDTRLGRIETADLLLWDGGASTPCLGFRGAPADGTVLRVAGFACGAPGRPVNRAALACAVDRIDLVSAGDDDLLRAVFVAAERRRGETCRAGSTPGGAGNLLSGRRPGWLDPDAEVPPLRRLFEGTNHQR